ncbi:MAG: DUF401 family protein [Planctomycetota bacterium]
MLAWLLALPVLVKILVSLGLILTLNALVGSLTVAALAGGVILGLWCGHPWLPVEDVSPGILLIAGRRLIDPDNLMLGLVILLVIWLSLLMQRGGVMRDLVATVRARISRRPAMAVLPAVIGWLPMPGGALFSAPLISECDSEGSIDPMLKAQTNYWFRHVWEYWWPLYPGVLLAMQISGLSTLVFMSLLLPLSLFSICVGTFFLLRRIPPDQNAGCAPAAAGAQRSFFGLILPILVVIGGYALVKWALPVVDACNRYLPMTIGLVLALLTLSLQRGLRWSVWQPVLRARKTYLLILLVFAIRVYGAYIDADLPDGRTIAGALGGELGAWGIPLLGVVILVPFLIGLVTGIAIGFVGGSFPIVFGMLEAHPEIGHIWAITVLAFGCGYIGMILSPVHVCLIVTNEHFATRLRHSLVHLLAPGAAMLVLIGGYYLTLHLALAGA